MKKNILWFLGAAIFGLNAQAQLTVQSLNAQQFVNQLLGTGIVASNITYSGGLEQIGSFNGQNCNIGLNAGGVLSTGHISVGLGPNNDPGYDFGGGYFGATDVDLDLIDPYPGHNDAAILEFDFVAVGDSIHFRYVFASEEYPEFVNSVNDIFGFFLSGPGINGPFSQNAINIALVPNTNTEVSINTINNGTNGISGPCMNCQYYVYNGTGSQTPYNSSPTYVQFDGFTKVLTARAAVQCGETYHIKIAIADAMDTFWDSSVFLEAGSFSANGIAITGQPDITVPFLPENTLMEGHINGFFTLYEPHLNTQDTLNLIISGTATPGVDYEPLPTQVIIPAGQPSINLPVTVFSDGITEGTETITIEYSYINQCGQPDTVSMTLFIADYIDMVLNIDTVFICPGTTVSVSALPEIGGTPNYQYAWSNGQTNSTTSFGQGSAGEYSVTVSDYWGESISTFFHVIEPTPFTALDTLDLCININSPPLASGGALPYTYTYDQSALHSKGNAVFSSAVPGNYPVTITDQCNQSKDVQLNIIACETLIPNIFSPNGDKINDAFEIRGIDAFPNSELIIYNRWGALVYKNENYTNQWKGEDMEDGVYYYIFKRSDNKTFEGYVHLSR